MAAARLDSFSYRTVPPPRRLYPITPQSINLLRRNIISTVHPNFSVAIERAASSLRDFSKEVHSEKWQGIDIKDKPEARMRELIGWDFKVPIGTENLDDLRTQIKPNLPWADEHFAERVCGFPMNPGESWKTWPWAKSAGDFLKDGIFEINYMERFWAGGMFTSMPTGFKTEGHYLTGIRQRRYGDLSNILGLLAREPLTRQAYLPIYFPEDTGAGGRVPCSLGYHWIMRGGYFHVHYPIRSCDFYRHFRDDIYLCLRLTLWILEQLRNQFPTSIWKDVKPGYFSMWVGSLHLFVNDYRVLFSGEKGS